jgi:DCN1-like protein 4/5
MRRSSTRRTGALLQPAGAAPAQGTGNKAAIKELEKIDGLFNQYADKADDNSIGPDGIEALCDDLGVSPTDIRVLLLAWKLQAARQGYFSLEEWRKGLKSMRVDSLDKLKKALPQLQQEVTSPYHFKDFYTFSFKYCLTEPRQKTLDLETACQMLDLVLGSRPHVGSFLQFLQEQSEYKAMNLDQWSAFLRFCDEIKPDLSNYDESQAWPLLLDNYVEWARKCMLTMS